jgi:hypothetical protein
MGDGNILGVKQREELIEVVICWKIRHVDLWVLVPYYYLKGLQ